MTGRQLYELWCTPEHQRLGMPVQTDQARYFDSMNPADKAAWDRLALHLGNSINEAAMLIETAAQDREVSPGWVDDAGRWRMAADLLGVTS